MHSLIFKMFHNVACVSKKFRLNEYFLPFFIFFLLIRIMCIKMLHVFQMIESIHETQAGYSLEYENIHTWYIYIIYLVYNIYNIYIIIIYIVYIWYINILFSLPEVFYKRIFYTHSYLVCVRTAKDARCKIKIWDALMSQKPFVPAEVLLSLYKQLREPSEFIIITNFILNL